MSFSAFMLIMVLYCFPVLILSVWEGLLLLQEKFNKLLLQVGLQNYSQNQHMRFDSLLKDFWKIKVMSHLGSFS